MKILILTQYFPPEVGAPQNRLFELAIRLNKNGTTVDILTAMPNYPQMEIHKEYKGKFYTQEELDGLKVYRSWIFVSKSKSIPIRLMNYFSFVFSSLMIGLFKLGKYDYILCESPPLFLGISAYFLKIFKGSKMIFNVSDLWPESAEKLGLVTNRLFLNISTFLEEFLYRKSYLITGQTQGIVKDISSRIPNKNVYWLPNGVDMEIFKTLNNNWRLDNNFKDDDFILLYAGIIGHAQGLEVILNAARRLMEYDNIKFALVGNGPEKDHLLKIKEDLKLNNVFFFGVQPKSSMPYILSSVDGAIIPLKKLDIFKGAIPSKIFETLAMRIPLLLGVEGEAKELFIDEAKAGFAFEPENDNELSEKVLEMYNHPELRISAGNNGFNFVQDKFTRDIIATKFWDYLSGLGNKPTT
ncbi:MAG: glycosyltransferase family 4 protein [Bacteroidota bacterium]